MRVCRNIDGICPFCKTFVLTSEPSKVVWWGSRHKHEDGTWSGESPTWRVAHVDCEDHYKQLPEPECFAP